MQTNQLAITFPRTIQNQSKLLTVFLQAHFDIQLVAFAQDKLAFHDHWPSIRVLLMLVYALGLQTFLYISKTLIWIWMCRHDWWVQLIYHEQFLQWNMEDVIYFIIKNWIELTFIKWLFSINIWQHTFNCLHNICFIFWPLMTVDQFENFAEIALPHSLPHIPYSWQVFTLIFSLFRDSFPQKFSRTQIVFI